MHPAITKLLSIGGQPLGSPIAAHEVVQYVGRSDPLGKDLAELLSGRDGFYVFGSALLVRPLQHKGLPLGLLEWNAQDLWKEKYAENLSNVLFFAEDAFGGQFCIRADKICTFDPEMGQFDLMSASLGAWASDVLTHYEFRTGYPLAHNWQLTNTPLLPGMRLLPKMPFVCGGKYEVENLYALNDVKGMQFRASIANQIRDLPDGSQIVLEVPPPMQ